MLWPGMGGDLSIRSKMAEDVIGLDEAFSLEQDTGMTPGASDDLPPNPGGHASALSASRFCGIPAQDLAPTRSCEIQAEEGFRGLTSLDGDESLAASSRRRRGCTNRRRKRSAPPLVLQQIIARVREDEGAAALLLSLGAFLAQRDLLTRGGRKNLEAGLTSMHGSLTLGLQDVRSSGQALAVELWKMGSDGKDRWAERADLYFLQYDRGKPRRPTRLQRLYLDWSRDLGWLGLLQSCSTHPQLWRELGDALSFPTENVLERRLLEIALRSWEGQGWGGWIEEFETARAFRMELLILLPWLPGVAVGRRLRWLLEQGGVLEHSDPLPEWTEALIRACACRTAAERSRVRQEELDLRPLERLAWRLLERPGVMLGPELVAAFRVLASHPETPGRLERSLSAESPLRRIRFGSRPGRCWWTEILDEMAAQAHSPS